MPAAEARRRELKEALARILASCGGSWRRRTRRGPRFDVPVLGLRDATIGEICLAGCSYLGDEPTLDIAYFRAAASAGARGDLDEAERL
jgi:hypothetical protein